MKHTVVSMVYTMKGQYQASLEIMKAAKRGPTNGERMTEDCQKLIFRLYDLRSETAQGRRSGELTPVREQRTYL